MRRPVRFLLALPLLLILAGRAGAEDAGLAAFFGEYAGRSISETGEGLSERDLSVTIAPSKDGFRLDWTTVTFDRDGEPERKSYSISFHESQRPGIYAAAQRPNLFGGWVPLDPMKGEPYVWARLEGRTLTVYAMLITEDGGYEMQIYDRTLTEGGMHLKFRRFREGKALKEITGTLQRVAG